MKLTLKLKDMNEVKRFVDITSQYSEDMALVHGRYVVDAKSILGIISGSESARRAGLRSCER